MKKIIFSWSTHYANETSVCSEVETMSPEELLDKIYQLGGLEIIRSDDKILDAYLDYMKMVQECHKKLKKQIDPSFLTKSHNLRDIFLDFASHIISILVYCGHPFLDPEKTKKSSKFFASFLQNDPDEVRTFMPPFDFQTLTAPLRNITGSRIIQRAQSAFVFYYIVDFLRDYVEIINCNGRSRMAIKNETWEPKKEYKALEIEQPSTSHEVSVPIDPSVIFMRSPSGLVLVEVNSITKVSFSWETCLANNYHFIEEIGYASIGRLARLIYGRNFLKAPKDVQRVCLSIALRVQYAHFELFNNEDLESLYDEYYREILSEKFFNFMKKSLSRLIQAGFPLIEETMVERSANFLTSFVSNHPLETRQFYPSPLYCKSFNLFTDIMLRKENADQMANDHCLFLFHYLTQFIRKLVVISYEPSPKLILRSRRDDVGWNIYHKDPEMRIFLKKYPDEFKTRNKNAAQLAFCWVEYLTQPCLLFEEVQSLTAKALTETIYGSKTLENVHEHTKQTCTSIARKVSRNHGQLYQRKDIDLLYMKDSQEIHSGFVFHFLLRSLKRIASTVNEKPQPLLTVADLHTATAFFTDLFKLPVNSKKNLDLSPILMIKTLKDFVKKEEVIKILELIEKMSIFFFQYILSYLRKFVTLSPDGSKLILLPKEQAENSVYATNRAGKYLSMFRNFSKKNFIQDKEDSMLLRCLSTTSDLFCHLFLGKVIKLAFREESFKNLKEKALIFLKEHRKVMEKLSQREVFARGFSSWPEKTAQLFTEENLQWLLEQVSSAFSPFDDIIPPYNRDQINKNIVISVSRDFFRYTKLMLRQENFEFVPHPCPFIDDLPSILKSEYKEESCDIQRAIYFNAMYFYSHYAVSWIMQFGALLPDSDNPKKENLKTKLIKECVSVQELQMNWLKKTTNFDSTREIEVIDNDMECLGVFEKEQKEPLWTMELSSDDENSIASEPSRKTKEEPIYDLRKVKKEPSPQQIFEPDPEVVKKIKKEIIKEAKKRKNMDESLTSRKKVKEEPRDEEISKKKIKVESREGQILRKKIKQEVQ